MSPNPAKVRIVWNTRLITILLITVLLLGSQPVQTAQAATITVDTLVDENDHDCLDGDCSLRDAIETANPGDTIDFSVTGTITLGGMHLYIDKNLTISGPGASSLTISGADTSRVFSIDGGNTVTISGLTITNGLVDDVNKSGGGINNYGTLTLNHCIISENFANYGGAIKNLQGAVTLNNCTISGNTTDHRGGGIHNRGDQATFVLNNCTVNGNESVYVGGGIFNEWGTMTVNNSTIEGNTVDSGGGIYNLDGTLTVNNSTISGNTATLYGGGIYNTDGSMNLVGTTTLNHCSITDNTANDDGGGIYNRQSSGTATVNFENTLVAGNIDNTGTGAEDCYITGGTLLSQDYNLTGSGTGCSLGGANDQTTADAKLLPLGDNGGDTETHALDAGSPALNQIPDGTNGCGTTYTEDQRGVARPQGTYCDIGAFELAAEIDTIGMYSRTQKTWYLKDSNNDGWANVSTVRFGSVDTSWTPVEGDWNGDGTDTIGMYSRTQKTWYLKDANDDGWANLSTVRFGSVDSSWTPVVGDWNGNGTDTVGMYSRTQKTWYLKDANDDGWANLSTVRFGSVDSSWTPVVGDWNGNGTDTIGMYSRTQKTWYLKDANDDGWANVSTVRFGSVDTSWTPVVGDWDGDWVDTIGMYSRTQKTWYLKDANDDGWSNVTTVGFGSVETSWFPVTGKW